MLAEAMQLRTCRQYSSPRSFSPAHDPYIVLRRTCHRHPLAEVLGGEQSTISACVSTRTIHCYILKTLYHEVEQGSRGEMFVHGLMRYLQLENHVRASLQNLPSAANPRKPSS